MRYLPLFLSDRLVTSSFPQRLLVGYGCNYSAGRKEDEVRTQMSSPGDIATPYLEFDGCPKSVEGVDRSTPHQDLKYPHRVKIGACPITSNVLLIRQRGHARAWPNRVQAAKGIARQSVFPSWAGWQDKRLSSSCIRRLCTGQDSIWIRSRCWVHPDQFQVRGKRGQQPTLERPDKPAALLWYTMPGIPSSRSRLGSRWARTLVYHPGARLLLAGSQKASFQQSMAPGSEGFCLAATCSI